MENWSKPLNVMNDWFTFLFNISIHLQICVHLYPRGSYCLLFLQGLIYRNEKFNSHLKKNIHTRSLEWFAYLKYELDHFLNWLWDKACFFAFVLQVCINVYLSCEALCMSMVIMHRGNADWLVERHVQLCTRKPFDETL